MLRTFPVSAVIDGYRNLENEYLSSTIAPQIPA